MTDSTTFAGSLVGRFRSSIRRAHARLTKAHPVAFSLLLHLGIVLLCGSAVVIRQSSETGGFAAEDGFGLVLEDAASSPPRPPAQNSAPPFQPSTPPIPAP